MKLTQAVFNGVDAKFKWAFVGTNGDHVFSEYRPVWNEMEGCYAIRLGDKIFPVVHEVWTYSRAGLFESAIPRAPTYKPGEGGTRKFAEPVTHIDGPSPIHQYAEELFIWYDEAGLIGGAAYSYETAIADRKRYFEWLDTPNAKIAPVEFQKLLIADARHNAARMVDDNRLTMDQFNEIFSEQ